MFKALFYAALFFGCHNIQSMNAAPIAKERVQTTLSYKPFRKDFPVPIVQLRLNERFRGTFLFDTGSNISVLTDVMAATMGLSPRPATLEDGSPLRLWDGSQAQMVTVARLELGTLPITDAPLVVVQASRLHSIVEEPVDGVIGANALVPFAALFDFQQHQITLWYPGGLSPDEIKGAGLGDAIAIPMKEEDLSIPVRFNKEVEECLILDTGAARTVISHRLARQLKLKPIKRGRESYTFFGRIVTDTARVQSLSIGDIVINDVIVAYPQNKDAHFPPHIGLDILSRYQVLIDFPQKKIYLRPAPSPAEKPSDQKQ